MNKNKGITYTVISCLAIVSVVVGLFVYSTVAEKELTKDQYKLLKFYELNTKRELSAFNLLNNEEPFTKVNFQGKWNLVFLGFAPIIDSKDKNYDMDHSMNLALINPGGQYHGFFKTPHDPKMMAEALTSIIKFSK